MTIQLNFVFRPFADLRHCFGALTRFPLRRPGPGVATVLAPSAWAFPLVGVVVGAMAGIVYAIAVAIGFPDWIAAPLAIAAEVFATGGLHEDGLADVADGFGGGRDRDAKLAIMRDSRIGAFGVLALILSMALRLGALVVIARSTAVAIALMTAGALSRTVIVWAMFLGRPARDDGLGAAAGRVDTAVALIATAIALIASAVMAGPAAALIAAAAALGAGFAVVWLAMRQIGGTTGDVYGAIQQFAEMAALLALSRVIG